MEFDTETVLQIFYRSTAKMRKSMANRKKFNDIVWDKLIKANKVKPMSKKFSFHHDSLLQIVEDKRGQTHCTS